MQPKKIFLAIFALLMVGCTSRDRIWFFGYDKGDCLYKMDEELDFDCTTYKVDAIGTFAYRLVIVPDEKQNVTKYKIISKRIVDVSTVQMDCP